MKNGLAIMSSNLPILYLRKARNQEVSYKNNYSLLLRKYKIVGQYLQLAGGILDIHFKPTKTIKQRNEMYVYFFHLKLAH